MPTKEEGQRVKNLIGIRLQLAEKMPVIRNKILDPPPFGKGANKSITFGA
jgi:hypothetical protein